MERKRAAVEMKQTAVEMKRVVEVEMRVAEMKRAVGEKRERFREQFHWKPGVLLKARRLNGNLIPN